MVPDKYKYMNLHKDREYTITIIGLGKLGSALASQLTSCTVKGWDVVKTDHSYQTDTLYEAIKDATTIFLVVPSEHFESSLRDIIREYSTHRRWHDATNINFITFTKGICNGRLPIEILKRELPSNPRGVISGPMLSEEMYHERTYAMLGTNNIDVHAVSGLRVRMKNLRLEVTTDTIGVTLCGIIKNVYAVGMGMVDGYNLGDNLKASIATKALQEMEQLIGDTVLSYAGIGDFLTTCYSSKSRNYTYGYQWAKGHNTDGIMAEGVKNIDQVLDYCSIDLPIVKAIKECLRCEGVQPLVAELNSG
tara:strand:+ start:213 stop:1130 length:918 start_codon:yes stop_codon:yes gene_type:complete